MTTTTQPIPTIMLMDDAQLSVTELVEKWCCQLIQALQFDYDNEYPSNGNYHFMLTTGRKYHKIVNDNGGGVHCFIDKQTGEVYKPASWKSPHTKYVRFDLRIINDRAKLHDSNFTGWAGGYLYLR